ncbi:MAG: aminoacyl-tRNA hydrolase [Bryobacteraceae bacterium]|nr:aminoacyl-tRNA hydrolase [Bryobacteraceae bacterium]
MEEPPQQQTAWLAVGLGNPGRRYALTPHNLGFLVLDRVAERNRIPIDREMTLALVGNGEIGPARVTLAKPQTFMNRSGQSVKPLLDRLALAPSNLLVVFDDLDLPWTGVRIRARGSAGGHHGVESVIHGLGSADFIRVRLGVNPGEPVADGAKFVLAPLSRTQVKELDELLDYGAQAVESIIVEGVEKAMAKFNRRARDLQKEEQ